MNNYDLTKASERFRALEDGRGLICRALWGWQPMYLRDAEDAPEDFIRHNEGWTLEPIIRYTQLWVYKDDVQHYLFTERSEKPRENGCTTLIGAIAGSAERVYE